MRWMLLLIGLIQGFLGAELSDHFKLPLDQKTCQTIKNVDFIYMINLDERPEKYSLSLEALAPYGIVPYRFSAVNGWKLTQKAFDEVGIQFDETMESGNWGTSYLAEDQGQPFHDIVHVIGRTYYCHCMSKGAIGIALSHLSILQDAYDSGYETIWVMEDDIAVIRDPHEISSLIRKLDAMVGKSNWDILFTDRDTKDQKGNYVSCLSYAWRPNFTPKNPLRFQVRKSLNRDFDQIGARYGAYSMIVRRSGMEKLLNFLKRYKVFLPYDMEFTLPDDIRLFSLKNDVVSTIPNALSDNGGPNYQKNNP